MTTAATPTTKSANANMTAIRVANQRATYATPMTPPAIKIAAGRASMSRN
ncbi:MAG TPA: hypothetical protein VHU22_10675 [Xanthobacteraceae bacterium]|nr:hypothetical protein [Xanthobacteraceae bacterium]